MVLTTAKVCDIIPDNKGCDEDGLVIRAFRESVFGANR